MSYESTLQQVFNNLVNGEPQTILFVNKNAYESTRVALLRKFKRYKDLLDSLGGANPLEGKFLRCSWDSKECSGRFMIDDDQRKSNNRNKLYIVSDL